MLEILKSNITFSTNDIQVIIIIIIIIILLNYLASIWLVGVSHWVTESLNFWTYFISMLFMSDEQMWRTVKQMF